MQTGDMAISDSFSGVIVKACDAFVHFILPQ